VPAVRHAGRLWGRRRTGAERGRIFASLIYPRFGNRPIESIKRSDIVRLLDDIGEKHGPHRAQVRLAILSTPFNWHASRDVPLADPPWHDAPQATGLRTGC
jgi:hypothetical protein